MKRPGHCTLCDKAVFEILQHKDGEPLRIGQPLPDAWKVTFLLSDETTGDITICSNCLPNIPESHDLIWSRVLERFDHEETKRVGEPSEAVTDFLKHIKTVSIQHEIGRTLHSEAK